MIVRTAESHLDEAIEVTNRVARTFSLAIRFLPSALRSDVYLLYLVCRTLDDLVDNGHPQAERRLTEVRAWAGGEGGALDREEVILEYLVHRYPALPRDAIADFCDAQVRSLGSVRIATEDELDRYCYGVAGTVGRLMAGILGTTDPRADAAARALGIAMQRTNILRDLDEDLAHGCVYLPEATLQRFGIRDLHRDDRAQLLRHEIAVAQQWYDMGLAGIRFLNAGGWQVRAAALMYRAILGQIEADGLGRRRPHRASVPTPRKLWLVTHAIVLR